MSKYKSGSKSDKAQLSLDVLVGLTIFMVTFIFILQYLPSIFVVHRSDISLSSNAYRVAALLAESPGYWTNGTNNGTDWESHWKDPTATVRVGLCEINSPCKLLLAKVLNFSKLYKAKGYDYVSDMFGIENYNISLQYLYSNSTHTLYSYYKGKPLLVIGKRVPKYGDVVKYDRIVYFDTKLYNITNKSMNKGSMNKGTLINVTPPIGTFTVVVVSSGTNSWLKLSLNSKTFFKLPKSGTSVSPGIYDLTKAVADNINGNATINVTTSNLEGYAVYSSIGQYVGGRIAAKLVVYTWS